jgi:hypothetical protein
MKINYTKHIGSSKVNPKGETRYFLNGLEQYSDFDFVLNILKSHFETIVIEDFDGIWFRRGVFENDGIKYIMYWDEDLGIFFVDFNHSEKTNKWLDNIIKIAIPLIEDNYDKQKTH